MIQPFVVTLVAYRKRNTSDRAAWGGWTAYRKRAKFLVARPFDLVEEGAHHVDVLGANAVLALAGDGNEFAIAETFKEVASLCDARCNESLS